MTVKIFSAIMKDWKAIPVTITATCEDGDGFSVSGLITKTIHRDLSRLQLAILNCGFGFRQKKLHVDIEPAIYEGGETLMLAIATVVLMSAGKIPRCDGLENYLVVGGLGITGNVHEIDGAVSIASMARLNGFKQIILPASNIKIPGFRNCKGIYAARDLISLVRFFRNSSMRNKIELPSSLLKHLNFN